jgi:hypothetical protein
MFDDMDLTWLLAVSALEEDIKEDKANEIKKENGENEISQKASSDRGI